MKDPYSTCCMDIFLYESIMKDPYSTCCMDVFLYESIMKDPYSTCCMDIFLYESIMKVSSNQHDRLSLLLLVTLQASTVTQTVTGPVGPVTPRIYWSCKNFAGPTNISLL